jgi:hypothetical protein
LTDNFFEEQKDWREHLFKDIMNLSKKVCPIPYYQLVLRTFYELNVNYYRPSRKGATLKDVTCKEIDALIGIGSLNLSEDGIVSIPKKSNKVKH